MFFFSVILKVEGESSDGVPSSPPSEEHIPDLYGADFYIGGVPPNFRINSKNNIVLRSFLGCISDIQVQLFFVFLINMKTACFVP